MTGSAKSCPGDRSSAMAVVGGGGTAANSVKHPMQQEVLQSP